jgi:hypothetical protein
LCVYDSATDLRKALAGADPLEAAREFNWLALSYESNDFLAAEDLNAIQRFGWHVAAEEAYPAITRIGSPGPELHSPTLEDLLWLDGALRGLGKFTLHHLKAQQAILQVKTSTGAQEIALRISGS